MSGRSFRSVGYVAAIAGAALSCYLVSLRVAAERAALEDVEGAIVLAQRDIRLLQTEIGTRGRLAQLERWNVKVLALSAPKAEQFLEGGFALARLVRPQREVDLEAPVVLASAPAPERVSPVEQKVRGDVVADDPPQALSADRLMYTASLTSAAAEVPRPRKSAVAETAEVANPAIPSVRKERNPDR